MLEQQHTGWLAGWSNAGGVCLWCRHLFIVARLSFVHRTMCWCTMRITLSELFHIIRWTGEVSIVECRTTCVPFDWIHMDTDRRHYCQKRTRVEPTIDEFFNEDSVSAPACIIAMIECHFHDDCPEWTTKIKHYSSHTWAKWVVNSDPDKNFGYFFFLFWKSRIVCNLELPWFLSRAAS